MRTKADHRTRLYMLAGTFCLLLALSLVLLYILHRHDGSGVPTLRTVSLYSNELRVPPEGATRLIVPMEEVSVRGLDEQVRYSFLTGVGGRGERGGHPDVKYPDFKSATPCFGQIYLSNGIDGWRMHFALDHSEGKADVYDQFYFDEDYDFDLRNNAPRRPLKDPNGLPQPKIAGLEFVWFEPVKIDVYFESEGQRPIELLPRVRRYKDREVQVTLVPSMVHRGRFELGGTTYEAFLGCGPSQTGRLNLGTSILRLVRTDGKSAGFDGGGQLSLMWSLDGRWCRFSCTPTGDQLHVYPYEGPLGLLRLDAGNRKAGRLEFWGILRGPDARIAIGQTLENGLQKGTDQYEIPVGDYCIESLEVIVGNAGVILSGTSRDSASGAYRGNQATCNIAIRADQPFTLRFSHQPRVVFVRPERKERFARGSDVRIEALLTDPGLDVMLNRLSDMTHSEVKTYTLADGRKYIFDAGASLEPKVAITRAGGEIVGQGTMPFG